MTVLAAENRRELGQWLACGIVVLCVHAAVVGALMQWREPVGEGELGDDVILLELRPEAVEANPVPEKPVEQQVERKADPLPLQQSEVTVAPEVPKLQEEPPPPAEQPPAPATTAAQTARARASVAAWQSEISKILEHNKRYPKGALARRSLGVAQVAFSIDREGHVISSRIVTSSGSAALDEEALALVQRVQPFPAPPPEVPGDEIKFVVPVRYK
jgi:protein TonB